MNFTKHYGLLTNPTELDFVNINLKSDTQAFIDPWLIKDVSNGFCNKCAVQIQTYFDEVLKSIRTGDESRALDLLDNLHEINWTRFGYSTRGMRGKAIASEHAGQIYNALKSSKAVRTGILKDIEDAALLIPGVGKDKISDIVTNVCLPILVEYTNQQAVECAIPQHPVGKWMVWKPVKKKWCEGEEFVLPIHNGIPILLVPKAVTNTELAINGEDFYNKYMLTFEQQRHLSDPTSGLCRILKTTGERRPPSKKELRKHIPYTSSKIVEYANDYPELLEQYKKDLSGKKSVKKRKK